MNDLKIVGQIMSTKKYDDFKLMKGNRKLNKVNYAKLVKSINEEQLIIPILVNEKMEIIDGQHRFAACKDLNKPVYFFIINGYGIDQVKRANAVSSNWIKEDYLEMFIEEENKEYIEFKGIRERYDISISNLLKVFAKTQNKQVARISMEFEDGQFTLENKEKVIEFLTSLEDFNFFKGYKTTQFITAFLKLFFKEDYSHTKMKERLEKHKHTLEKKISADEYLALLCNKIYSFGPTKNPIYYSSESKRFHQ